jgi:hypothetical protein
MLVCCSTVQTLTLIGTYASIVLPRVLYLNFHLQFPSFSTTELFVEKIIMISLM